tara:strand:- start:631 stop:1122 length:492 start_codon:yes stop_codon:yes gene_type:complete
MTRVNTRSSQTRETNERVQKDYVFEEPSLTNVPTAVEEKFKNSGMTLGWLRIDLKGNEDYQNIGKKQQQGWEFVTPEEVPEMGATSVVRKEGRYAGVVCRGDLALGKIPTFKLEAKKAHYLKKSGEMMDAVNKQLMSQSNSQAPISNTSKSSVTKGRRPSFQD